MAKRSASSAATDLSEQLMPLRSDPVKLHEALARVDAVLIEDAFARLLDVAASVDGTAEKRQKLARDGPRLKSEIFEDVAAYLDRDALDSMQLSWRFMNDFIRKRETDKLPLRPLSGVHTGKTVPENGDPNNNYWLPITDVYRDHKGSQQPHRRITCLHSLSTLLRLSYCEKVFISQELLTAPRKIGAGSSRSGSVDARAARSRLETDSLDPAPAKMASNRSRLEPARAGSIPKFVVVAIKA